MIVGRRHIATLDDVLEVVAGAIAYRLPRRVLYWAVVKAACAAEPRLHPGEATAIQMLEAIQK